MSKHPPHTYLILMALWLLVFSSSSQVIIIAPILPRIGEALAVSETLLGMLGTSYALMLSLFAVITGPDCAGERPVAPAPASCAHGLRPER